MLCVPGPARFAVPAKSIDTQELFTGEDGAEGSDDEEALQDVPMIIPFEDLPQLEAAGLISHSSVLQTKAAARSHWKLKHDPDLVPDVLAAERRKRTAEEKRVGAL